MADKSDDKMQKLYDSLKDAHQKIQAELINSQRRCMTLEAEKNQWEKEKVAQQIIIQNTLNRANALNNEILEENRRLKEELNKFKS